MTNEPNKPNVSKKIGWGILSTGAISTAFARALQNAQHGHLAAVASRGQEKADKFGDQWNVPAGHRHATYEALLADPTVDAVYVSTPHPMHAEWVIKAAEAGKHILCEKPIGLNVAESMAMIEAAQRHNVFLMEAFMYRCHPQTAKIVELIKSKAIGEVRLIQATFSFHAGYNADSRCYNNDLGGGGIMDVGCYAVSFSRLVAGVALGLPGSAEPTNVTGAGKLAPTGVDEYAVGTLTFANGINAQVSTGVGLTQENTCRIYGTAGNIFVSNPWTADRANGGKFTIKLTAAGKTQDIELETSVTAFTIEADLVAQNILAGKKQAAFPAMSWDDTMGNLRTLDRWREAVGVVFNREKPEGFTTTIANRKLAKSPKAVIPTGTIKGLNKAVSRLVMGVDNQSFYPHAAIMFDDFFEQGGNAFDSAFIYGGGRHETVLGDWIKTRGIRDQVVILGKGAHTPHCNPKAITEQLKISLDRYKTDHVDIYMMHRDNLEIPVGEFIDVLNEHKKAGRIKGGFGGSNWSLARVEEANKYAASKGLEGFTAVSNNFSLATMQDAIWAGCIHSSDKASREWLTKTQTTIMPWSSQARGFFTDRGNPADKSDAEMVRVWHSADNFKRRERAIELAKKKGCDPIHIALAYVLNQPFPTFPLIGPRFLWETRSSLNGANLKLTSEEVSWLAGD